jgi:nitrite reductase/ring-hydroxylating ferredoxin subunit
VSERTLCSLDAVPDNDCLEVVRGDASFVVMRSAGRVWAYRNVCPHFSLPLNAQPNEFLVVGERRLMCAFHCAIFRFEDGLCIEGPAEGLSLDPVAVEIVAGEVRLQGS